MIRVTSPDPVEPRCITVFPAQAGHQLHADADAKKRAATVLDRLDHRVKHASRAFEGRHAGRKSAVSRQHDTVGAGDHLGI